MCIHNTGNRESRGRMAKKRSQQTEKIFKAEAVEKAPAGPA